MSPITELIGGAKAYGWGSLVESGAFEFISSVTATSQVSSFTFTSIPQTYTHLQLRCIGKTVTSSLYAQGLYLQFGNGSVETSSLYAYHIIGAYNNTQVADGTANTTQIVVSGVFASNNAPSDNYGVGIVDFFEYSDTSKFKTVLGLGGTSTNSASRYDYVFQTSGVLRQTAAIDTIKVYGATDMLAGTTFALYGIKGS
jgi:hypothetical protein